MRAVSASLVLVLCAAVTTATGDVITRVTEETPPALGLYSVKNEKGVVCLLAEVAVRLLLKTSPQDDNIMLKIFNINPNVTRSSGSCSENKAQLRLDFPEGFVQIEMKKVNGIAVANSIEANLNYSLSDKYQVFTGKVDNLKARMSRADMSYICKVEQAINLSESISVSASNLHLQAFGVQNNTFSSASECSLDHAIPASTTTPTAQSPLNVMSPPIPPVGKYNVSNSGGKVCALFEFSLLVVVNYTMKDNKTSTGYMAVLPNMTNATGSCNKSHTVLFLHNKNGSFIFNFTKVHNASKFILQNVTVQFNKSFHSAKTDSYNASNSSLQMFATSIGKAYLCHLNEIVQLDSNISLHLKQVHVQPFDVKGGKFSESNECKQDPTTPAPITTPPAPITTPPAPITTPTPPPLPPVGNYNVSSNGTISALFKFSLLIIVNYTMKDNKTSNGYIAVYPNMTNATGNCFKNKTVLSLKYKNCSTNFIFTMDNATQKFILQQIDINANYSFPSAKNDTYIGTNSTLQLFTAKVGNSYLCVDEKTVTLSSGITLHMSNVQLQPFHVNNGKFGTAENCTSDIAGLLIPIIVGAVLALLLLIVLIVYVIGRRRSHAGYQAI